MALIECPECGKQISENARMCPNCGYSKMAELWNPFSSYNKRFMKYMAVPCLIILTIMIVLLNYSRSADNLSITDNSIIGVAMFFLLFLLLSCIYYVVFDIIKFHKKRGNRWHFAKWVYWITAIIGALLILLLLLRFFL